VRTRVGEINVVDEMRKRGARIGGEGNGGVISPDIHLGRDSLAGIAYVLEMMAERGATLSGLASALPQYAMIKGKVRLKAKGTGAVMKTILKEHAKDRVSAIDGIRIDFLVDGPFRGGWVHLRPSNTEPIFRVIAEGRDKAQASAIYARFAKKFR
jgi:phosphomannomutase